MEVKNIENETMQNHYINKLEQITIIIENIRFTVFTPMNDWMSN
jgi:hypothetical protein